ncbi:MAG: hypothetical protein ABIH21_02995 [Patescibacteria group bacterium]
MNRDQFEIAVIDVFGEKDTSNYRVSQRSATPCFLAYVIIDGARYSIKLAKTDDRWVAFLVDHPRSNETRTGYCNTAEIALKVLLSKIRSL